MYSIGGRNILCSAEQVIELQRLRGLTVSFDADGNLVDEENQAVQEKAKKSLTPEQKEKLKQKKKRNKRNRAIRKMGEPLHEGDKGKEHESDEENEDVIENQSTIDADALREDLDPDTKSLSTIDQIIPLIDAVALREDLDPDLINHEKTDYQDIINQEIEKSKSKKKSSNKPSSKDQSAPVLETIEISPEVVWIIEQAYKDPQDQEKVRDVLDEIAHMSNNTMKQDEGEGYLKRLAFLLGQKRDFQVDHVKILNVDFRYHRVHGSHNNDWSIDMVRRLKVFGAKIQVIFDKILLAPR
jgi:hypothetical protein